MYRKLRKANIDTLDEDAEVAKKGRHALTKEAAKIGAGLGTAAGSALGYAFGKKHGLAGAKMAKTIAIGAGAGGAMGGLKTAIGTGVGAKLSRVKRNVSSTADTQARRKQDQLKVANGDMTRKEFIEKYGKEAGRILN